LSDVIPGNFRFPAHAVARQARPPGAHRVATPAAGGLYRAAPATQPDDDARAARERAAAAVARANAESAQLSDGDARRILALRVHASLEGGNAAVLRPAARQRLVRLATDLGLRAFDAHLVIAIAQDAARRGEPIAGEAATARLRLVGSAGAPAQDAHGPWGASDGEAPRAAIMVWGVLLGLVGAAMLAAWIAGG
jgi:hypothetical protein